MIATRALLIALPVSLVLGFGLGWAWRGDRAEGAEARTEAATGKQSLQVERQARATEHRQADALADIGAKHENDREATKAVPDAVVADLRNGSIRMRDGWAGCETKRLSDAATAARERDEAIQRREKFAGAVVRVGREADDQLAACQAVINTYQDGFGR